MGAEGSHPGPPRNETTDRPAAAVDSANRFVRVYLDCDNCYSSYLRRNLTFVHYVGTGSRPTSTSWARPAPRAAAGPSTDCSSSVGGSTISGTSSPTRRLRRSPTTSAGRASPTRCGSGSRPSSSERRPRIDSPSPTRPTRRARVGTRTTTPGTGGSSKSVAPGISGWKKPNRSTRSRERWRPNAPRRPGKSSSESRANTSATYTFGSIYNNVVNTRL